MKDSELMDFVLNFLCEEENITLEVIKGHWKPESEKPNDLALIYRRFCDSAQNMQMAQNVVSKSIGGIANLALVTNNFNVQYVTKKFAKVDHFKLLEEIKIKLKPKGKIRTTTRSVWPKFCKAIIDGAHYLNKFQNHEYFYNYVDQLYANKLTKNLLPVAISLEVKGFGIALAADFLKEIGYVNFGKPDVHLQDILIVTGHLDPNLKNKSSGIFEVLNVIDSIAGNSNLTSYAVDKSIWLIGSGNYYNSGFKTKNRKREFMERIADFL